MQFFMFYGTCEYHWQYLKTISERSKTVSNQNNGLQSCNNTSPSLSLLNVQIVKKCLFLSIEFTAE